MAISQIIPGTKSSLGIGAGRKIGLSRFWGSSHAVWHFIYCSESVPKDTVVLSGRGILELAMLHPLPSNTFVWAELPDVVKMQAEMRFYNGTELEDAYKVYGVDQNKSAVAVVRPDGYIGFIAELKDTGSIYSYLKGV